MFVETFRHKDLQRRGAPYTRRQGTTDPRKPCVVTPPPPLCNNWQGEVNTTHTHAHLHTLLGWLCVCVCLRGDRSAKVVAAVATGPMQTTTRRRRQWLYTRQGRHGQICRPSLELKPVGVRAAASSASIKIIVQYRAQFY